MEEDRFKKIEEDPVLTGIVKKEQEKSRFDHLEVGGKEVEKQEPATEKRYFPCPKCNRNNQAGNLYCIYCGYVFPEVAETTESDLKPYEMKCPQCGKTCNRNQKLCIWCGYHFVATETDILKDGKPVEIEIDGVKYSSADPYLPAFVRTALAKIKREKMAPEKVGEVVQEMRLKKAEIKFGLGRNIEKGKYKVTGYGLLAAGGLFMFLFRVLVHASASGWVFLLAVLGGLLIITGLATAAMGMTPGEIEEFRGYRRF